MKFCGVLKRYRSKIYITMRAGRVREWRKRYCSDVLKLYTCVIIFKAECDNKMYATIARTIKISTKSKS